MADSCAEGMCETGYVRKENTATKKWFCEKKGRRMLLIEELAVQSLFDDFLI